MKFFLFHYVYSRIHSEGRVHWRDWDTENKRGNGNQTECHRISPIRHHCMSCKLATAVYKIQYSTIPANITIDCLHLYWMSKADAMNGRENFPCSLCLLFYMRIEWGECIILSAENVESKRGPENRSELWELPRLQLQLSQFIGERIRDEFAVPRRRVIRVKGKDWQKQQ